MLVFKQLLTDQPNAGGTDCSVISLIDIVFTTVICCISSAQDITGIICSISIGRSLGIVKQIMGQNIVRCVCRPVCAIVTVGSLTVAGIRNCHNRSVSGIGAFIVLADFPVGIFKIQPIAAFAVSHLRDPIAVIGVRRNGNIVLLDGCQFSARIGNGVHKRITKKQLLFLLMFFII